MLHRFRPTPLRSCPRLSSQSPVSSFHTSCAQKADNTNYYETLGLPPTASQADIKKQFYTLSRQHHPDHHPDDPTATTRFVALSTAYATLGSPEKRARYDRDTIRLSSHAQTPKGSHSSHSPYGARPASGLSKRRAQFHGPPPSFYNSGGWGAQGTKRAEAASGANPSRAAESNSANGHVNWDNDVPHFDREGHLRTQSQQERRRKARRMTEEGQSGEDGGSMAFNFVMIGGIVGLAMLMPAIWEWGGTKRRREDG